MTGQSVSMGSAGLWLVLLCVENVTSTLMARELFPRPRALILRPAPSVSVTAARICKSIDCSCQWSPNALCHGVRTYVCRGATRRASCT